MRFERLTFSNTQGQKLSAKVDIIDRELEITGPDLTPEQRQSIADIADKCPVHRTLHSETHVRTTIKE